MIPEGRSWIAHVTEKDVELEDSRVQPALGFLVRGRLELLHADDVDVVLDDKGREDLHDGVVEKALQVGEEHAARDLRQRQLHLDLRQRLDALLVRIQSRRRRQLADCLHHTSVSALTWTCQNASTHACLTWTLCDVVQRPVQRIGERMPPPIRPAIRSRHRRHRSLQRVLVVLEDGHRASFFQRRPQERRRNFRGARERGGRGR
eukprot:2672206-Rhodomonas_salina.2